MVHGSWLVGDYANVRSKSINYHLYGPIQKRDFGHFWSLFGVWFYSFSIAAPEGTPEKSGLGLWTQENSVQTPFYDYHLSEVAASLPKSSLVGSESLYIVVEIQYGF